MAGGGGMHGRWACVGGGHAWQKGVPGRGACMAERGLCVAGETATAANGTHPTGMHSCS